MIQNEITSLTIKHEFNGKRIDKYLVSRFHEYSRSFIQGLINNGDIKVCDRVVKSSYEVRKDDVITLKLPEFTDDNIEPEDIPLDIIYEDDHMLVINKSPNMVVHPARGHARGTLVNAIKFYCNNLSGINGHLRPGIVHRLDKDTSGVIIVAKTDYSHGAIAKQFESRKVRKRYIAVVEGRVDFDSDTIRLPIGRHQRFREKMAIRYDNG
ncbi:MAG: pseudouridine synthase, partial [Candidatus Anammoxibacter sp.]